MVLRPTLGVFLSYAALKLLTPGCSHREYELLYDRELHGLRRLFKSKLNGLVALAAEKISEG